MRLRIWRRLDTASDSATSDLDPGIEFDLALLYEREAPRIHRRLSRRFAPDRAADLVQGAFARLLGLGPGRLAALEQPRAYLYRVADNLANDLGRSAAHRLEQQPVEAEWGDACDPVSLVEARDLLQRIEAALPLLPDRTREIFMAHRFDDLTYRQIAQRVGISVKTVEKHMSIALRELHRAVGNSA